MPTATKVIPDPKPIIPQEDPWASVTSRIINKMPDSSANALKSRAMHKGRHHGLRKGEMCCASALERAKLTAQRVAESTDQAAKAVTGSTVLHSSPSSGDKEEAQHEANGDSSLARARHTAKAVADSTAQAVEKLVGDNTAAVVINGLHGGGLEQVEDDTVGRVEGAEELHDPSVSQRADRHLRPDSKVQSWMDSILCEEVEGKGGQSLEKMTTTAEQVAESTASAVEKLSEALNGL